MKTETVVGLFVLSAVCVFFYLSFSIGTFRLDRARFHSYCAFFDDTAGLEKKDPVKIAGVVVGEVEDIRLSDTGTAKVFFMVKRDVRLAKNSRAFVRQEGLIGTRYLEVDPGDSSTGYLTPGSALGFPSVAPASVGEVLNKFSDIASSFKDVATSLQSVLASKEGQEDLRDALHGFATASNRLANFAEVMDRTLRRNEENVTATLEQIKDITKNLRERVPQITDDVHNTAQRLYNETLPSIKSGFDKISTEVADHSLPLITENFTTVSKKLASTADTIDGAALNAKNAFKEGGEVMEKINKGKGLVGRLINEDELYNDVKKTVKNVKDFTGKMQAWELMIDMHSESLLRNGNSKGYLDLRLRPSDDYFYQLQIVGDEKGSIKRKKFFIERFDALGNPLVAPNSSVEYLRPPIQKVTEQIQNDILFGFQFGKRFNRLAFRLGVFENTFGAGVDYYVPLNTDKFHWISSLEGFDWKGINRLNDSRPHIKWINKFFVLKNFYTVFGVDDIVSKNNANPFIGGGIRFDDNDLKYLLPQLPIGAVSGSRK